MALMQICSLAAILAVSSCTAKPVGYSYAKFSGPVSGPEREVFVHDEHSGGHGYVDYVAKPDYHFAYGVEDPKTRVLQNRKESRNGDNVKGEYSVVDPDGTLRVVKYTVDKVNGFQAEVITDGKSSSYGHEDSTPAHRDYHHAAAVPHAPVQHETYGTHEDVKEEEGEYEEDEEDDDDDGDRY